MNIETLYEPPRGCGRRKPGGLYLVSDGLGEVCPLLPVPLDRCPTCDHGIKPSSGWTWIDADALLQPRPHGSARHDAVCPLANDDVGRAGLIWVGEAFYKSPGEFVREAVRMGISRRVGGVPRGFEVGRTWVFLAHRKAIEGRCPHGRQAFNVCQECGPDGVPAVSFSAGVFHAFCPRRVEYVVRGESDEQLDEMVKRGLTPVRVLAVI